ncbi:terminase small subunit [Staphylococcus aureus]|uniref:terminase small subunit n=1 Tax=Staphylococcus aureus TaxID=1280 RepID=UPI00085C32AF|nr:terminase small subunit [Staphylococcus aureus]MBU7207916.1 terminase small subunit [Staphylococcus aureus]MBU7292610.1 terminase small subunit [Staphylococcus aureus]MBU7295513.1 terminase small subunit [Staphylococcus aureus]MDG6598726.1 terminase small subunit [Staphylococcus aureus]SCS51055.1 phage protein [Staphylococcus aureus]
MIKLTPKQEKFVLGLIEGKSQRKAYIDAGYSTKNKSDNYIDSRAFELSRNSAVLDRYEELRQEAAEQSKWTRQKAFEEYEWLKNVAKNDIEIEGVKKATADAFLASLDGMNRMTLGNEVLANKKIETEIKMLEKKIEQIDKGDSGTEDKIKQLHDAITEVIVNE